jgi:hypothetical protein
MIEGFYEACSDKCLGHDFRREETSQLLRSNMKGIRKVDNDLAVPVIELLRDILVSRDSPVSQREAVPPSTGKSIPVMKLLSSEARNTAADAISSAVPSRPIGIIFLK